MDAFSPIALEDKRTLDAYLSLATQNEGSECTFSDLYIWGKSERIQWKVRDDCLLLHVGERTASPCMLMTFARDEHFGRAIELAISCMRERSEAFRMCCIPLWYKERMEALFPGRFVFEGIRL